MRLDQLISQNTGLSRKSVKLSLKKRCCEINGKIAIDGSVKVNPSDLVLYEGNALGKPQELYYMLNKPPGFCCSHDDDGYPSVLTLLPKTLKKLHFAGRLDADTTGLLLLSSDGKWCHKITSPKQRTPKTKRYWVEYESALSDKDIQELSDGIMLRGEKTITLPATVEVIHSSICTHSCRLTISQGKYHQIKRMFAALNNKVIRLHRESVANITLDSSLSAGEFRPLNHEEISGIENG